MREESKNKFREIVLKDIEEHIDTYIKPTYEEFKNYFGEERVELSDIGIDANVEAFNHLNSYGFLFDLIISNDLKEEIRNTEWGFESCDIWELTDDDYKNFVDTLEEIKSKGKEKVNNIITSHTRAPFTITIHFPKETVTNEANQSMEIYDIFVKVAFNRTIILESYYLYRTTYTRDQYLAGYVHSHVRTLYKDSPYDFLSPCLGSGPFRNSIGALSCYRSSIEESLLKIVSFCYELERFIQTESLEGGPYITINRVSQVSKDNKIVLTKYYLDPALNNHENILSQFTKHLLETKFFNFNYSNKIYDVQGDFSELLFQASNKFIRWFNTNIDKLVELGYTKEKILSTGLLIEAFRIDGELYYKRDTEDSIEIEKARESDIPVFKGKKYPLKIIQEDYSKENSILILRPSILRKILQKLIEIINFNYEDKKYNNNPSRISEIRAII